jgi:hypothetical protein
VNASSIIARVRFISSSTSLLQRPSVSIGGSVVIITLPVQHKKEKTHAFLPHIAVINSWCIPLQMGLQTDEQLTK